MILFDAHTHIDMNQFKNDREQVIQRAKNIGLIGMVTSSIGTASFRRTLGIVKKHRGFIHHSAGCGVSQLTPDEAEKIVVLTRKYSDEIVAVGEVGLDYYWVKDLQARKNQEPLFQRFIDLANELNLPIVIHSRKAEAEATELLERSFTGDVLMHCFDGPPEVAKRVADNGWCITLPSNFGKYRNRRAAASIVPLGQILLETDGPYLSPTPDRNEPANTLYGAETLSKLLDLPVDDIGDATTRNALRFYRLQ
ncbi:MAG: TatD family deoxyribonuclease [Candidatus Thorarchaeota archaeon]|nr:TatD family deoxyribonuclease [Candidatus Thorarchaeota archaeon]